MEGHSICPLPEKKQSVSHIEKRCVEELKQQCFDLVHNNYFDCTYFSSLLRVFNFPYLYTFVLQGCLCMILLFVWRVIIILYALYPSLHIY